MLFSPSVGQLLGVTLAKSNYPLVVLPRYYMTRHCSLKVFPTHIPPVWHGVDQYVDSVPAPAAASACAAATPTVCCDLPGSAFWPPDDLCAVAAVWLQLWVQRRVHSAETPGAFLVGTAVETGLSCHGPSSDDHTQPAASCSRGNRHIRSPDEHSNAKLYLNLFFCSIFTHSKMQHQFYRNINVVKRNLKKVSPYPVIINWNGQNIQQLNAFTDLFSCSRSVRTLSSSPFSSDSMEMRIWAGLRGWLRGEPWFRDWQ